MTLSRDRRYGWILVTAFLLAGPPGVRARSSTSEVEAALGRVDDAHRAKIDAILPRLDPAQRARLHQGLRDFDKYSTFWQSLKTMKQFLIVVGFPTVGIITWGHASKFLGAFLDKTVLGAISAWGAGLLIGSAAVIAGAYALHHWHLRPRATEHLQGILDELEAEVGEGAPGGESVALLGVVGPGSSRP